MQWVGYTGERELVESIRENYPDLLEQLSFSSRAADVDTKRRAAVCEIHCVGNTRALPVAMQVIQLRIH